MPLNGSAAQAAAATASAAAYGEQHSPQPAAAYRQCFRAITNLQSRDDGVSGGDGWDDVPRDTLRLVRALHRDLQVHSNAMER